MDILPTFFIIKIVVGTCGTVGSLYKLKLRYGHFTHIFIDEAGQLTEPGMIFFRSRMVLFLKSFLNLQKNNTVL